MRSLDTNALLRFVLNDVPAQFELVDKLLEASSANSLHVADAVFFEIAWVLSGSAWQMDRGLIAKMLRQIAGLKQINCNRTLLELVIPLYLEQPQLSFIDCCLSAYAELNKATPLLTFDQNLAKKLPKTVQLIT